MEIAKLRVNGNRCSIVYVRDVTRGLIGATIAIEYTDPVWDGLAKTVVFQTSSVTKDVVTNKSVVDVPHEVLETVDEVLSVGVYGTNSEDTVAIPTLWATVGVVKRSADPSGDESTAPTLPVWAQILEQLEELGDVDPDKIAEAVEQYISENPIEGESAYEIALKNGFEGSEQEWLASLEGEKGDPGEPGATGPAGQPGKDGFSPTVTVEDITGGHRVTITDESGQKVFDVTDGKDGKDGSDAAVTAKNIEAALGYTPAKPSDIPAPYTLPAATADTLGGVKVGNGLVMDGGVLSVVGGSDDMYELVEFIYIGPEADKPDGATTVIDDTIGEIMRTDVSYDALRVTMFAPPSGGERRNAFVYVTFSSGGGLAVGSAYIDQANNYSSRYDIYKNGDIWDGQSSGQVTGWGGGNVLGLNSPSNLVAATKDDYINSVRLYVNAVDSATYPVGTTIKIYGVKHNA